MKIKSFLSFLLFLSVFACKVSVNINTEKNQEKEKRLINQCLDDWHLAAEKADFDKYFALMTDNAVFVGTDASEVWNKKEFMDYARPYFEKGETWTFKKIHRNIYLDETHSNIAWFDETLNTWMGICRGSGVVIKNEGKWYIQHYVLSLTIPNNKIKQVMKILNPIYSRN